MTSIDVCNLALAYLGNTRMIQSFSDRSTESDLCRQFYDMVRRGILKSYPWNFAVVITTLEKAIDLVDSVEKNATDYHYEYVYELPIDSLRVLGVLLDGDEDSITNKFAIRTQINDGTPIKRIVTDLEDAQAQYISDIQDVELMPDEFIDALALGLAARLAMPLSSSGAMSQAIGQQYQGALANAKNLCALEGREKPATLDRYSNSRT